MWPEKPAKLDIVKENPTQKYKFTYSEDKYGLPSTMCFMLWITDDNESMKPFKCRRGLETKINNFPIKPVLY